MLNYNGDVNHSQQVRHGAVVMFLTTHSVFEQLLLYDASESARSAERNGAWVGPARRRCSRPSAQRAHRHTGSLRACVLCRARSRRCARGAARCRECGRPSADVHGAPCRARGAAER